MATKKELAEEKKKAQAEIMRLQKESLELIIKRSGVSKKSIIDGAFRKFFNSNLDLLTVEERKKYKAIIL